MEKSELAIILNRIAIMYNGRFGEYNTESKIRVITPAFCEAWYESLKSYNPHYIWQGMMDYISENSMPPTVADLIKYAEPYTPHFNYAESYQHLCTEYPLYEDDDKRGEEEYFNSLIDMYGDENRPKVYERIMRECKACTDYPHFHEFLQMCEKKLKGE